MGFSFIEVLVVLATLVGIVFNLLSRSEVKKQEEIKKNIDGMWEDYQQDVTDQRIVKLQKLADYLDKQISSLSREVKHAKGEYKKILDIEHDKQQVLTPNALRTIYQSFYLIQSCIDNLEANQFYMVKMRNKALANIRRLEDNPDATPDKLDNKQPIRSVRGQSLLFYKAELRDQLLQYDGIHFSIDDWDDKRHFLPKSEQEEIPLFIHYFEPETQIGKLSFARGRLQSNLDEGFNTIKCRMENVTCLPYRASYHSVNNIRVPRRGLRNMDERPKANSTKLLHVWKTDRHLDYILAGDYNFSEAMNNSMMTIPVSLSAGLQKKMVVKLGKPLMISVKISGQEGYCFYRGSDFIYNFTISRYSMHITDAVNISKSEKSPEEMISFTVVFAASNKEDPLQQIQMLAFMESYTKEEERQHLYNNRQTEKTRINFFINAFQRLKDRYKVTSCVPIPISVVNTSQDSIGNMYLQEVHSPHLYLALHKMGNILDEPLYNLTQQSFCLKIADQVFIVDGITGDKISLQSQVIDDKGIISEGLLFLSEIPGLRNQEDALNRFRKGEMQSSGLHQAIIYPRLCPPYDLHEVNIKNPMLNLTQRNAIIGALSSPDIYLIQGPPGTGKTTVIIEIVRAQLALNPKSRILITSQSHVAVDNAMEDLVCDPRMAKLCCRMGSDNVLSKISPKLTPFYTKMNIPVHARIIGVTLGSIPSVKYERLGAIDLSIIDEAGKASFPETLPGIICARKLILVGDHKQLPPMVEELPDGELSELDKDKTEMWETSLFEMMIHDLPDNRKILLNSQHRMVAPIGDIVSDLFYEGQVSCGVSSTPDQDKDALYWYDCKTGKHFTSFGNSKYNIEEAKQIREYVLQTLTEQSKSFEISSVVILSAYRAQCGVLHKLFFPYYRVLNRMFHFSISTIDAYQGQQADVVIYSTVTRKGSTCFLKDKRRLNVALSRARRRFVLFGNSNLLCRSNDSDDPDLFGTIFRHPLMNIVQVNAKQENDSLSEMKGLVSLTAQEHKMKKNLLILTLGSRDVMKIVNVDGKKFKTRLDSMPILDKDFKSCIRIPDQRKGKQTEQTVGYCFPLLEKAIFAMSSLYRAVPDSILLIYTDRKELLNPLQEILLRLDEAGYPVAKQFTEFLIDKIQNDFSPEFATTIRENLSVEQVRRELGLPKAVETILIGLGRNYSQFKQVRSSRLTKLKSEDEVVALLSICDINREGFLYPTIYNELLPIIKDYQDCNVFCSTSGGLSQVGMCLGTVLDHLLVSSNRIVLQIPEDKSGFVYDPLAGRYNRYFELKRGFDIALLQLDTDLAKQIYKAIVALMALPDDSLIRKSLDPLVHDLSWSMCESGFETATLRLLSALYQAKYDIACMWAISLLESSVKRIIRGLKDPAIIVDDYDTIVLKGKETTVYVNNLRKLFYQRNEWKKHEQLNEINKLLRLDTNIRDNPFSLVSRISQQTLKADSPNLPDSDRMKDILMDFLGIDSVTMQQQFLHLRMGDWDKLIANEESLFGKDSLLYMLQQIITRKPQPELRSKLRQAAYKLFREQENLIYLHGVEEMLLNRTINH